MFFVCHSPNLARFKHSLKPKSREPTPKRLASSCLKSEKYRCFQLLCGRLQRCLLPLPVAVAHPTASRMCLVPKTAIQHYASFYLRELSDETETLAHVSVCVCPSVYSSCPERFTCRRTTRYT